MQQKTVIGKPKQCYYCLNNIPEVDYKDVEILRRFVSSFMKIAPRRRSGLCAWHQRKVSTAIKQARIVGLMPFTNK
ncbi:MAG TPA: 30S ribosomal protein S18 [Candidatus Magasanikbacteria bacterium]|uniref:Small ribosomal subunit protein bS18 n=1 Tax=Candidatus Magasanikbacteria bacterium GW2011_GWA2_46_17 TaxID=1619042 RepID=A0A0G1P2G7_9BACT|nr:MAG: 30S ribosomal protein S18 [Candidatus Magasanikbacteria bacterium GW2011_GWA2_46_17]OGH77679.1 MAG: 30S ribosomal protein S18 [Candidatus Magasanikbacteria bacterium RIFCSPLOWO2_02_FULL_47_16]OGH79562.1 MAG: 30S ribosomal protein S18 [Candidatus Magasanikbacteria bacterium RIFCSPHIGHO2_02_FULL_48_18]OGH83289.1 MAG: 30S ribosomal protein S18 [Candidatus Magasanikbacteria bacterium RIFCSPLOWO2_12_FULL_47_9b]HAZ28646.1 30S ribosomal protein S18 [Candidatus Magasanikbacteria bacterium]